MRASPARWSTTPGSRCSSAGDRRERLRHTTTSHSFSSTRPTSARSTRRSRTGAGRPASATPPPRGEDVFSYGNSSLRAGITTLSPKKGVSLGTTGEGWSHQVYTATPGIPGDSGSAFIDEGGRAFGVLSTVAIAPLAGSNGVSDLAHGLDYMRTNTSFSGVELANGTEPFEGGKLPVGG